VSCTTHTHHLLCTLASFQLLNTGLYNVTFNTCLGSISHRRCIYTVTLPTCLAAIAPTSTSYTRRLFFTLKLTHHLSSLPLATSSRLVQKTFFGFTFITYTLFSPFLKNLTCSTPSAVNNRRSLYIYYSSVVTDITSLHGYMSSRHLTFTRAFLADDTLPLCNISPITPLYTINSTAVALPALPRPGGPGETTISPLTLHFLPFRGTLPHLSVGTGNPKTGPLPGAPLSSCHLVSARNLDSTLPPRA
jgi:hypothetical protein